MPGNFAYSHGLNDQVYYPDVPADGTAARQQFMDLFTEIKDNMNNNLAQQTDLATKANQTDLTAHLAENATDAHNATAISVADAAGHFTGTEVEAVLAELFTFANDGKIDVASAIGIGEAQATDSFLTLASLITADKGTLATNLTNLGQASLSSEDLSALAAKVANIATGIKSAVGTVSSGTITVNNLTFQPEWVIIAMTNPDASTQRFTVALLTNENHMNYQGGYQKFSETYSSSTAYWNKDTTNRITANGFSATMQFTSRNFKWWAFGY